MNVYDEIKKERAKQDAKWGGPLHDDEHGADDWAAFIDQRNDYASSPRRRQRLLEIAALAVAAIESSDRKQAAAVADRAQGDTLVNIRDLQTAIHENAKAHGWWDMPRHPAELLCLVHSEVSEALECVRNGEMAATYGEGGKPEGYASELADVIIRVLDMAEAAGIDMEAAVLEKHAYNKTRSYRHGGKAL